MSTEEGSRLADFSVAVRDSTLKRLHQVPEGRENWRPDPDAMGLADLARHVFDCDQWFFTKVAKPDLDTMPPLLAKVVVETRPEYQKILSNLMESGERRAEVLGNLSENELAARLHDRRFGNVTLWWVIVRGNLDHEIHHRGQMAAYLRMVAAKG